MHSTTLIGRLAPFAAAAVLVAMIVVGGVQAERVEGADAYHARVRAAVERIPYSIGPWNGQDTETPLAAVRLLKPNTMLQRRYINRSTGRAVSLLVVHCTDVRDMLGHYPPKCYPGHGWTSGPVRSAEVDLGSARFPAKSYQFSRVVDGLEQGLTVLNFFVLPGRDEQIFPDMGAVDASSQSARHVALGAAQVQLLGDRSVTQAELDELAKVFVQAIEPAVRVIAEGV